MAKPTSLRVAEHRQRQKAAGMISITLVIPESETRHFRELAAAARNNKLRIKPTVSADKEHDSMMSLAHQRLAQRWAAATGLRLPPNEMNLKLAEVLAKAIVREIVRAGWPVGRTLGSENELLARYGVGRNVLREAIRLLEYQSVAHMRRGATGGLVVSEPRLDAVADMAASYLEYRQIRSEDLKKTRRGLQTLILQRCMEVIDDDGCERLRKVIENEQKLDKETAPIDELQRFHHVLAELTGDPALELLMDLILRLYRYHTRPNRSARGASALARVIPAHAAIADAVIAGDSQRAYACLHSHLEDVDSWVS